MLNGEITDEGRVLGKGNLTMSFSGGGDGSAKLSSFKTDGKDQWESVFGDRDLRCRGLGGSVRGSNELKG
jgi:hypothetical protein